MSNALELAKVIAGKNDEIERLTLENERFRRALNELTKVGYANITRMAMAYRALNGEEKEDA